MHGPRSESRVLSEHRVIWLAWQFYASAVGTTVLQVKEIPPRPAIHDGAVCLFNLVENVTKPVIEDELSSFGTIEAVELSTTWPPTIVRFSKHEEAIAAVEAASRLDHVCGGINYLYNDRAYDDRGWCCSEDNISSELTARLESVPKIRRGLEALGRPKMFEISSKLDKARPIETANLGSDASADRVDRSLKRIELAHFTAGLKDKQLVVNMYKNYVSRLAGILQTAIINVQDSGHEGLTELTSGLLPPMPTTVTDVTAAPLRLAEGQLLLYFDMRVLGSRWTSVGPRKPTAGDELFHSALTKVLQLQLKQKSSQNDGELKLPPKLIKGFKVEGLKENSYVRLKDATGVDLYFRQAEVTSTFRPGTVRADESSIEGIFTEGLAALAFDGVSQEVLPYSPADPGWQTELRQVIEVLRSLVDSARKMDDEAVQMDEIQEQNLQLNDEALRSLSDEALRVLHDQAGAGHEAEVIITNLVAKHPPAEPAARAVRQVSLTMAQLVHDAESLRDQRTRIAATTASKTKKVRDAEQNSFSKKLKKYIDARGKARTHVLALKWFEDPVAEVLEASGDRGLRNYAVGQQLVVRTHDQIWRDAVVESITDTSAHKVSVTRDGLAESIEINLHPWNHAPSHLPHDAFEEIRNWYMASLKVQHGHITDALTGQPLQTLQQCVAINMVGAQTRSDQTNHNDEMAMVRDAHGLSVWLKSVHEERLKDGTSKYGKDAVKRTTAALLKVAVAEAALEEAKQAEKKAVDAVDAVGAEKKAVEFATLKPKAQKRIIDAETNARRTAEQTRYQVGVKRQLVTEAKEKAEAAHKATLTAARRPLAALLTAGPAAGKTTLLNQLVLLSLEGSELVPILVKVQRLQRSLLDAPDTFASAWNFLDAYLRLEHGDSTPALYHMLRQAIMARRALILIDGLDEGGVLRNDIERHVTSVLARQGHVMLCTSRPAGVTEELFGGFRRLELSPLTDPQQKDALTQRLGKAGFAKISPFLDRIPRATDTGLKVTSNPLVSFRCHLSTLTACAIFMWPIELILVRPLLAYRCFRWLPLCMRFVRASKCRRKLLSCTRSHPTPCSNAVVLFRPRCSACCRPSSSKRMLRRLA